MTAKSIILTTIEFLITLSLVKLFFIGLFDVTSWYMTALFLFAILATTTAVVRQAGVVNHFEVIISLIFWVPVILLWDFVVLVPFVGDKMYYELYFWMGYVAMVAAIIIFHKWAPLDKE